MSGDKANGAGPQRYTVIDVERKEGGIAIIRLNRADKMNAANAALFRELTAAVQTLDADPQVGCMILTGQTFVHPKRGTPFPVFSAGADVEQFDTLAKTEAGYAFIKGCFDPFKAIELAEKPVIAAVNGIAFGFGFEISGTCDFTLAARSARLGLKEINHGAIPAWCVTRGLERMGKQVAAFLCLTGGEISADEARALGVVLEVVDDEKLMARAEELARRIAAGSPMARTFIKRLLNRRALEDYGEAERFMPAIFATEFMRNAFSRFAAGETKNVR